MNTDALVILARSATCFLLGWYVALGGVTDYRFIMLVNRVALEHFGPTLKWVVCWYAGKTVGLIVAGKTRG